MENQVKSLRYVKNNLEICPQVDCMFCEPTTKETQDLKDLVKTLKLETQSQQLRYEHQIFELNKKIFTSSQNHHENKTDQNFSLKLQKKKEKIQKLKQEVQTNTQEFLIFSQEIQQKAQKSIEELTEKYEKDMNFLLNSNKILKEELSRIKKSFKSESCFLASELFSNEKKKLLAKISRLSSQRNEAHAKLEVMKDDLRSFQSLLQVFNKEENLNRVDQIIQMIENEEQDEKDLILSNLLQIKEDFSKMQLSEKLHQRVLSQKNQEIQEMKKNLKVSPTGSKAGTTNSSPTSCQSSSFFRNFSPKHVPSYSFQEDTKKGLLGDDMIITEFAGLKLKYALLQEFLMKRDNDFRLIFHEMKKKQEVLPEMIELVYQKLEESQKFLD